MTRAGLRRPPRSLTPLERRLWRAVTPSLERVSAEPLYAGAVELLVQCAGAYFEQRRRVSELQDAGNVKVLEANVHALAQDRRLVVLCCRDFLLHPPRLPRRADVVDMACVDRWLDRVFSMRPDASQSIKRRLRRLQR